MAETWVTELDREQIGWLDRVLGVLGEPIMPEDVPRIVTVLECARGWYMKQGSRLRMEDRGG